MPKYGWVVDSKKCIECRACEAACKQWNGVETGLGMRYRLVRTYETGSFPNVSMTALSLACNHCGNPLCLKACPTKAMYRHESTGAVLINAELCVGCRFCEEFCPYGAPQFNAQTHKMEKCTMCFDRLEQGLEPACVALCPTGAIRLEKWEDIEALGADRVANFPNPITTQPSIRFITEGFPQGR